MFSWGTNSMGQCGQGHSTGSVIKPARVQGLEDVQVQQIAAGTSHSLAWTALPCDRYVCTRRDGGEEEKGEGGKEGREKCPSAEGEMSEIAAGTTQ